MNITLSLLKSKRACDDQVRLFRIHFGEGPAPLDDDTALRMASVFDFDWAAQKLLSPEGLKAYVEDTALLWKTYDDANAPLWKAYVEDTALLWKTYYDAKAPMWKAYKEAKALAFVAIARKE